MAYATLTDLIERAGEIEIQQTADRDGDMIPDAEVIASALEDASDLIDSYIATRYNRLQPPVPRLVTTWAVSIARYFLFHNGAPDHVVRDYDYAIAALNNVQAGRSALPVAPGVEAPVEKTGRVMASHPPIVFTAARLRGWR